MAVLAASAHAVGVGGGLAFPAHPKEKVSMKLGVFHRKPFFSGCYIGEHFDAISKDNDQRKLFSKEGKNNERGK